MPYRRDLDGLRAIAILSVLGFHLDLAHYIPGGFVGVDVFFVMSGYLIGSILLRELSADSLSLTRFYERRIRRIFPALFAMLAAVTAIALLGLLPGELVQYSQSLLAATTWASNFYFWLHSNYFELQGTPLLVHTWSLAVEEQFYLLFPLLLLAVRRFFPRRLRLFVLVTFIVSFAASVFVVYRSQNDAFYLPFTRAWELLLGTLLVLGIFPAMRQRWQREAICLLGLGLIAYADLFFSTQTLFPGPRALLPCLGAACLIGAGASGPTITGSMLSWRPIAFIGLISYSLYLWHWPVILFQEMGLLINPNGWMASRFTVLATTHYFKQIVELLVTFVLATFSWFVIERPFRAGRLKLSGRPLFALAGVTMLVFIFIAGWVTRAGGLPSRFPQRAVALAAFADQKEEIQAKRMGECFFLSSADFGRFSQGDCLRIDSGRRNYLLLGDSHAAVLWSSLAAALPGVNVLQANAAGCAPTLTYSGSPVCEAMLHSVFQDFLPRHSLQTLILAARWKPRDMAGLGATLDWARQRGIPTIVLGPVPEYDGPLPRLLAYSVAWRQPGLPARHLLKSTGVLDARMQTLARAAWHVPYISLYQEICDSQGCLEYADAAGTIPLMFDDNHLSQYGAALVVSRVASKGLIR